MIFKLTSPASVAFSKGWPEKYMVCCQAEKALTQRGEGCALSQTLSACWNFICGEIALLGLTLGLRGQWPLRALCSADGRRCRIAGCCILSTPQSRPQQSFPLRARPLAEKYTP